jgi:hypothetical protein
VLHERLPDGRGARARVVVELGVAGQAELPPVRDRHSTTRFAVTLA